MSNLWALMEFLGVQLMEQKVLLSDASLGYPKSED
jgi:hypothetical protein